MIAVVVRREGRRERERRLYGRELPGSSAGLRVVMRGRGKERKETMRQTH